MLNILCVGLFTQHLGSMYTFEIYKIKIYQFYAQKLGVGMKETMMDTGVGIRQ